MPASWQTSIHLEILIRPKNKPLEATNIAQVEMTTDCNKWGTHWRRVYPTEVEGTQNALHVGFSLLVNMQTSNIEVTPFSHNHGSVENYPKWKETHIGDTPMFHFNDNGKKVVTSKYTPKRFQETSTVAGGFSRVPWPFHLQTLGWSYQAKKIGESFWDYPTGKLTLASNGISSWSIGSSHLQLRVIWLVAEWLFTLPEQFLYVWEKVWETSIVVAVLHFWSILNNKQISSTNHCHLIHYSIHCHLSLIKIIVICRVLPKQRFTVDLVNFKKRGFPSYKWSDYWLVVESTQWKICSSKWASSPQFRGENIQKMSFELPPPRLFTPLVPRGLKEFGPQVIWSFPLILSS